MNRKKPRWRLPMGWSAFLWAEGGKVYMAGPVCVYRPDGEKLWRTTVGGQLLDLRWPKACQAIAYADGKYTREDS